MCGFDWTLNFGEYNGGVLMTDSVLCLSCVIEATPQLDNGTDIDVPTRPVVVWRGRSWCIDHWLEVVLPGGEAALEEQDD